MTYINTNIQQPGIVELLFYKGATGKALSNLAHTLLQGPSGLTSGERELIASYVSKLNDCTFCHHSHAAAASVHLGDGGETVRCVVENVSEAPVSAKMKALLHIAAKVQQSGKAVSPQDVAQAKAQGATDEDLHDTVLIAAAFCMFNRYVDGLNTRPAAAEAYAEMGQRLAKKGYRYPPLLFRKLVIWMMHRGQKKKSPQAA